MLFSLGSHFSVTYSSWQHVIKLFSLPIAISQFRSVQFSHLVVSDSLQPHVLQQTRLLCLSPTPGACSNSCAPRQWCHPTISSSVNPFSSCLQSFPTSGSFQMSQLFTSGGQNIDLNNFFEVNIYTKIAEILHTHLPISPWPRWNMEHEVYYKFSPMPASTPS